MTEENARQGYGSWRGAGLTQARGMQDGEDVKDVPEDVGAPRSPGQAHGP